MSLDLLTIRASLDELEQYINEAEFVPSTNRDGGTTVLALLSKSLTVSKAVCVLVEAGFAEEAFGLSRTLIDVYFIVRYLSNADTESRAERYLNFSAKDHESWGKILPKYFPAVQLPNSQAHRELLEIAKKYQNPHEWSGVKDKTRGLATEPDTFEFDANGVPMTAEVDYELFFKWTSHFVHATVSSLESHLAERGDTFKVRTRYTASFLYAQRSLLVVLVFTMKTFVSAFRALKQDQPEDVLHRMHQLLASLAKRSD
jgi:hypothetical protein